MDIKYGLISADSHVVVDRDAFTRRMSKARWGELAPQVVEVEGRNGLVDRWRIHGDSIRLNNPLVNCPAAMDQSAAKPARRGEGEGSAFGGQVKYPQHWDEVPLKAYAPAERAKALDDDGVDAEVLFPNDPAHNFIQWLDPEYELACVQAHNDALSEWTRVADRFIPLVMIPYLSDIDVVVSEVARAAQNGHRGINMFPRPGDSGGGVKDFTDPYWDPLWATCQDLGLPVHVHGPAGLGGDGWGAPGWEGITPPVLHTYWGIPAAVAPAAVIPHVIFSGIAERFPRLNWVLAECGIGAINYAADGCQHAWETLHLWTDGLLTPPREIIRRQMHANFYYEVIGIQQRDSIGVDNIMWESDYPHVVSSYPHSWETVEQTLQGVPEADRKKLLYQNAMRVYHLA
ncbi:MAG: Amidohydrolase [Chloroflexi bacterium]|nr:Amidohydrolase [Chloroflexota bacterium]